MKLLLIMVMMVMMALSSCASLRGTTRSGGASPAVTTLPESPERKASNALIDEGQKALALGLHDHAADLFQQSVTVDSTNGAGYYYLALVKMRSGEYGEVWGLLDKAQVLLASDPDWMAKIEELRQEMQQKQPN